MAFGFEKGEGGRDEQRLGVTGKTLLGTCPMGVAEGAGLNLQQSLPCAWEGSSWAVLSVGGRQDKVGDSKGALAELYHGHHRWETMVWFGDCFTFH